MKQMNPQSIYSQNIEKGQEELVKVKTRIYQISIIRVLLFVAGVVGGIYYFSSGWGIVTAILVATFLPFLALMKHHNRLFYKKDYLEKQIEINQQELEAIEYRFSSFDGGSEFIDSKHLHSYDLDLFGASSFFQYINRTSTSFGKECLGNWFNRHLEDKVEIIKRQEAVRELTPELKFRQHFRVLGLLARGAATDKQDLLNWINVSTHFSHKKPYRLLPYGVMGANLVLFVSALIGVLSWNWLGFSFVGFLIVSSRLSSQITKLQMSYGKKLQLLSTYAEIIEGVEQKSFESDSLKGIRKKMHCHSETASSAVYRLARLMNLLDQRNNILVSSIFNGLFFWELLMMMKIEIWKENHSKEIWQWFEAIGEIDAYCSLATFAFNHPEYVYPTISDSSFVFKGKALGHPLIHRDKCVKNDVDLEASPSFLIVTGANMAGKSTYLRTVGLNYFLACIGAPVCAKALEVYPARLVTSLRTTDSLSDNESYFFAELKRLKLIIDKLNAGEELFIILDEILKGTNSMDKQKGSLALVKQLVALRANGMIATHDLLLGSLVEVLPEHIHNCCFEADIVNEELIFSYRLREGVAQNMNACFLMKKMGIAVVE